MLAPEPTFERIALNRVTFGARDVDEAYVQSIGWDAYVEEQLNPPSGDDDALAAHLAAQTMHIQYPEETDVKVGNKGWEAVDEDRPLNYLDADTSTLWNVALAAQTQQGPREEVYRIYQEIAAASWIRASQAEFQIREFMVDFWNNHFNVHRDGGELGPATLPVYDRDVIRPYVFGNFREMLEANATSTAMLLYLDNAGSTAEQPNENYARELLELHTMGENAYLGVDPDIARAREASITQPDSPAPLVGVNAPGFTDDDVIEASRALSGWTLQSGQDHPTLGTLPNTGEFVYNPHQHNNETGFFLGIPLQNMQGDMEQGRAVLDLAASHPATAEFICTKICVRIFGETPPEAVVTRAIEAFMDNQDEPDQLKKVMEAILCDGPEVGGGSQDKLRRPFEIIMGILRTTDAVVNAHQRMAYTLGGVQDGIYVWPTPDGRPDTNAFFTTTSTNMTMWNILIGLPYWSAIQSTMLDQTPSESLSSATEIVEHWVGRMVGYELSSEAMTALIDDAFDDDGVMNPLSWSDGRQEAERALHAAWPR